MQASTHGGVDKGWVRDEIVSALSKQPSSLTEVSVGLGVAKSTASYHLANLMRKGIVEIVEAKVGRGGTIVKKYGLKRGSLVLVHGADQEEVELRRMRVAFDAQTVSWTGAGGRPDGAALESLLYQLFLHMFRVTRSDHARLMEEYGEMAGALLSRWFTSRRPKETLGEVVSYLRSGGVASADLIGVSGRQVSVVVSSVCIGSKTHESNSCYFLEGMVRGVMRARFGGRVEVMRLRVPGVRNACSLAVGRVKGSDVAWLEDAVLSSPMLRVREEV